VQVRLLQVLKRIIVFSLLLTAPQANAQTRHPFLDLPPETGAVLLENALISVVSRIHLPTHSEMSVVDQVRAALTRAGLEGRSFYLSAGTLRGALSYIQRQLVRELDSTPEAQRQEAAVRILTRMAGERALISSRMILEGGAALDLTASGGPMTGQSTSVEAQAEDVIATALRHPAGAMVQLRSDQTAEDHRLGLEAYPEINVRVDGRVAAEFHSSPQFEISTLAIEFSSRPPRLHQIGGGTDSARNTLREFCAGRIRFRHPPLGPGVDMSEVTEAATRQVLRLWTSFPGVEITGDVNLLEQSIHSVTNRVRTQRTVPPQLRRQLGVLAQEGGFPHLSDRIHSSQTAVLPAALSQLNQEIDRVQEWPNRAIPRFLGRRQAPANALEAPPNFEQNIELNSSLRTLWHGTSLDAAERILASGVLPGKAGTYGYGLYLSGSSDFSSLYTKADGILLQVEFMDDRPLRTLDIHDRQAPHLRPLTMHALRTEVPLNFLLRDHFGIDLVYGDNDDMIREFVLVNRDRIRRIQPAPVDLEQIGRRMALMQGATAPQERIRLFLRHMRLHHRFGNPSILENLPPERWISMILQRNLSEGDLPRLLSILPDEEVLAILEGLATGPVHTEMRGPQAKVLKLILRGLLYPPTPVIILRRAWMALNRFPELFNEFDSINHDLLRRRQDARGLLIDMEGLPLAGHLMAGAQPLHRLGRLVEGGFDAIRFGQRITDRSQVRHHRRAYHLDLARIDSQRPLHPRTGTNIFELLSFAAPDVNNELEMREYRALVGRFIDRVAQVTGPEIDVTGEIALISSSLRAYSWVAPLLVRHIRHPAFQSFYRDFGLPLLIDAILTDASRDENAWRTWVELLPHLEEIQALGPTRSGGAVFQSIWNKVIENSASLDLGQLERLQLSRIQSGRLRLSYASIQALQFFSRKSLLLLNVIAPLLIPVQRDSLLRSLATFVLSPEFNPFDLPIIAELSRYRSELRAQLNTAEIIRQSVHLNPRQRAAFEAAIACPSLQSMRDLMNRGG
jgi:hypothetical protein